MIKKVHTQNKISRSNIGQKGRGKNCDQFPSFSFRYLTTNKKYNFKYFKSDKNKKREHLSSLIERLSDFSSKPFTDWLGLPKKQGFETIDQWAVKIKPNNLELPKDEKIYVFRFHRQQCRVLGVRRDSCPIIYIIGMDFDHSAYDHGS